MCVKLIKYWEKRGYYSHLSSHQKCGAVGTKLLEKRLCLWCGSQNIAHSLPSCVRLCVEVFFHAYLDEEDQLVPLHVLCGGEGVETNQ